MVTNGKLLHWYKTLSAYYQVFIVELSSFTELRIRHNLAHSEEYWWESLQPRPCFYTLLRQGLRHFRIALSISAVISARLESMEARASVRRLSSEMISRARASCFVFLHATTTICSTSGGRCSAALEPRSSRCICAWNITDLKKNHAKRGFIRSPLKRIRIVKSLATAGSSPSQSATFPNASPDRLRTTSPARSSNRRQVAA